MCMKVNIHEHSFVSRQHLHCLLGSPDGWLLLPLRLDVKPVQILPQCVESVVPSAHAVRVQSRNDLEDEILTQLAALLALQIGD